MTPQNFTRVAPPLIALFEEVHPLGQALIATSVPDGMVMFPGAIHTAVLMPPIVVEDTPTFSISPETVHQFGQILATNSVPDGIIELIGALHMVAAMVVVLLKYKDAVPTLIVLFEGDHPLGHPFITNSITPR